MNIVEKSYTKRKEQAHYASMLFDNSHYFPHSEKRLGYHTIEPLMARRSIREKYPEYVGALREIRHGKYYAEDIRTFLDSEPLDGDFILEEEQRETVESIAKALDKGQLHSSFVMPTGAGKTLVFAKIAQALGLRTLVVTPSQVGVEQIAETFEGLKMEGKVGMVYEHVKDFSKQITVTTYDSLQSNKKDGSLPHGADERDSFYADDYDLVIFDEAHMALTPKRKELAHSFQHCIRLAATATPYYSDEKEVESVFGDIVHRVTIEDGVHSGLLAQRISAHIVKTKINLTQVRMTATGDYDEEQLREAVNVPARNNAAADVYAARFLGQQVMVKCIDIQHAEDVKAAFEKKFAAEGINLKVGVVHSKMTKEEKKAALAGVKNGEITVICAAKMLDFAFDAPQVSVAFNLAPTLSRVVEEQFGGRVIRKDRRSILPKHARIVDFLDIDDSRNRSPVIYANILGKAFIRHPSYKEKHGLGLPMRGPITGGYGEWEYIATPRDVIQIARELETQDINIDFSDLVTINDILDSEELLGDRRVKLIRTIADRLRAKDYKRFKIPPQKVSSLLYPRTIMELLPEVLALEYKMPPEGEGWITEKSFARLAGRQVSSFGRLIDADIANHPERRKWVKRFANNQGRSRYLNLEYQAALSTELRREVVPLPEGFSTVGDEALKTAVGFKGKGVNTVTREAERIANEFSKPEWIQKYWNGKRLFNIYADDLRDILKKEVLFRDTIPLLDPGTTTFNDLRKRISPLRSRALRIWVEELTGNNPNNPYIGLRRNSRGLIAIAVPKELQDETLAAFGRDYSSPIALPNDHVTIKGLVQEIFETQVGEGIYKNALREVEFEVRKWLRDRGVTLRKYTTGSNIVYDSISTQLAEQVTQEVFGIIPDQN